jgi:hypothetical protein
MKKKVEIKKDGKEFERFDDLLRQVVSVPKSEIDKREKKQKKRKEQRKANA